MQSWMKYMPVSVHLKSSTTVHIPGAGDLCIVGVSVFPDPCHTREQEAM